MSISQLLMNHVEKLQEAADRSFKQYPENEALLPNDALYVARYRNAQQLFNLIENLVKQSGKPLGVVLTKSIEPNAAAINTQFNYVGGILNVIIQDFKESTVIG